jgi:hypothetical protein
MGKQPVVSNVELSKKFMGGWKLKFSCPGCQGQLNTSDTAIGKVDDCQLCGAQFLISPKIREQIEGWEEAQRQKEAAAAQQKKQTVAVQQAQKRRAETEKQEDTAERRREREASEYEKGYDYPNLRSYQKIIETFAIVGAFLAAIAGLLLIVMGIVAGTGNGGVGAAFVSFITAVGWFFCGAVWYFTMMISAESLRLFVTAALDIRAIRDATSKNSLASE